MEVDIFKEKANYQNLKEEEVRKLYSAAHGCIFYIHITLNKIMQMFLLQLMGKAQNTLTLFFLEIKVFSLFVVLGTISFNDLDDFQYQPACNNLQCFC